MNDTISSSSEKLIDEIARVGARVANQTSERYLETAATSQIVGDLRRAAEGGASISQPLSILLKLNDHTLSFAIAALRNIGRRLAGTASPMESESALADALAESLMTNFKMSLMLRELSSHLSSSLKRLEKSGVNLESDLRSREALRILAAYNLWKEDPDDIKTSEIFNELFDAARIESQTTSTL